MQDLELVTSLPSQAAFEDVEPGVGPALEMTQEQLIPPEQVAPYTEWDVELEWVYDSGQNAIVPSANGTGIAQAVSVIQVRTANAVAILRFSMARIGFPCATPLTTPPPGSILLSAKVIDTLPKPSADGESALYRVRGEYKYASLLPGPTPIPSSAFPIPQYGS